MSPMNPPRTQQIVVAFDFSPSAERGLELAIGAAVRAPHQTLHVLAVLDRKDGLPILHQPRIDLAYVEEIQRMMHERITELVAGREPAHELQFFTHARLGAP